MAGGAQGADRRLIPVDHPLSSKTLASLAELGGFPFILFQAGFALNAIIQDACRRAGVTPQIAARSSQVELILELIAAGLGVGFLPRMMVESRGHSGVRSSAVSDPGLTWHMALAWRRGAYLGPPAQAWLEIGARRSDRRLPPVRRR